MDGAIGRPSLAAFRIFELAGRYQSFTRAARKLGVTPGAVVHRVRTLKHCLGELLFEETLVPVCSPAFLASRGWPGHPADLHGWPPLYDLA